MTPKERLEQIRKEASALREIAAKSTPVVAWYPHGYDGTVRGPFGRWFKCSGGDNGMGDPEKHPVPVADIRDDVAFAAAAMNNLVLLLEQQEFLLGLLDRATAIIERENKRQGRWCDSEVQAFLREIGRSG